MEYIAFIYLFSLCTIHTSATTHWMVTESGLIQPRDTSQFQMANPYDLLAFLNQDNRWDNIIGLYHDLSLRQVKINSLWSELEKYSDLAELLADETCEKAEQLNSQDWYTSFLVDGKAKHIADSEYQLNKKYYEKGTDIPDCKKISSLTFSMFAFEHLEAMMHRDNLTISPELSLPELISPIMTLDQFGHWTATILRRNSSSWLHYNMASLYWRVRGNAVKAVECSRRAVHYAPRHYKDIALLSLGTVFHRSKLTEDAIVVLGAAVDHEPRYSIHHFVLASAYAVQGDFNNSILHYDISFKLNPTLEIAVKHKKAVMCHAYLKKRMLIIQGVLMWLREELFEYSVREAHWLRTQASFLRIMKHEEEYDYTNVEKNCEKMEKLTGLNIKERKREGDANSVMQYFLDGTKRIDKWAGEKGVLALEAVYGLQKLMKQIQKLTTTLPSSMAKDNVKFTETVVIKEIGPFPSHTDMINQNKVKLIIDPKDLKINSEVTIEKQPSRKKGATNNLAAIEGGRILYPNTMKVNRNNADFDKDPDWPNDKVCKETAPKFPENVEAIYPTFLPFENKGLRVMKILTNMIGVPAEEEHELPWYPPLCPQVKEAAGFITKKVQKTQVLGEVIDTDYLRLKLWEYAGGGKIHQARHMQDVEIGHRIYAAMQMNVAPEWVLYTLSSLYWRVRDNHANALNCLMSASRLADVKYRDIVHISLGSLFLEMGYFDEALKCAEEAFKMGLYEPATNFLLSEINMLKKLRVTHIYHLKQVVRIEPGFMGGLAKHLLCAWGCIIKQINALQEAGYERNDICNQLESRLSMVCDTDGNNCHITNIHCYSNIEKEQSSTLVRMLEVKDEHIQSSPLTEDIDPHLFDSYIDNMPALRGNKYAHNQNFNKMKNVMDRNIAGCGSRGCSNMQPEDLSLTVKDCSHQNLQLSYWLTIISFRQFVSESNPKIPAEITALPASNRKIPDCRLTTDASQDFFLDRITQVKTDGWNPLLSLMHQIAELFNLYDYVALGAKIAKYMETKPRSWVGAVAAGWWCGAGGRGECAVRCLAAATEHAPASHATHALRALTTLLHMQSKHFDAKDMASLAFYMAPRSKIEAVLVAISHTYLLEYEQAIWMYRYSLLYDDKFLPAKACLHATMCLMMFGEKASRDTRSKKYD